MPPIERLVAGLILSVSLSATAATPPASAMAASQPGTMPPAAKQLSPGATGKTEIVQADFGLFSTLDSGQLPFTPAKVVPLKPGQVFGWMIILNNAKPRVKWREEFTLPAKPKAWGGRKPQGSQTITSGGRVSTLEREVEPYKGMILNTWSIAEGDPPGRYVIKVTVEGLPARTFVFEVK